MINDAVLAIIVLDVFNVFSDSLKDRFHSGMKERPYTAFIGDCVIYTTQLLLNNGWDPERDTPAKLFDVLQKVITLVMLISGINCTLEYSDDLNHIIMI